MWKSILAIALGAALGALLRWFLGLKLNSLLPSIPPARCWPTWSAAMSSARRLPISPRRRASLRNGGY